MAKNVSAKKVTKKRVKKNVEAEISSSDKLNGIAEIKIDGYRVSSSDRLYSSLRPEAKPCNITLIPYYAWGNRGLEQMSVWIPEE